MSLQSGLAETDESGNDDTNADTKTKKEKVVKMFNLDCGIDRQPCK